MRVSPRSRIAAALMEAMSIKRAAPGEVPFKQTSLNDPHVQQIVQAASAQTGVPAAEIEQQMQQHIDKIEEMKQYSYLLYDTAARNAAQSAAFDLIAHSRDVASAPKFDVVTFVQLVKMIQMEHEQFFPLRAPGETNYIFSINPILLPSNKKEFAKWNDVINTAAATAKGEFLFNVPFMQKLMDFAHVEGLRPKGKKYESNGGPIPDEYAYIEFLIMHELLHYSYGDFTQGEKLKQYSPTTHNYASDFRSNYMLVKNGYDQLPIGLFSDHINYDRQGSYKEMVELVHNELKKMPKPLQDKFKEIADMDQHEPDNFGEPSEPGEGKPGSPSGDEPDPDQVHKDIEDKLGKREEIGSKEEADKKAGSTGPSGRGTGAAGTPGQGGRADLSDIESEVSRWRPRHNWRSLIKQLVTSSVAEIETTYAKPSRRAVTGISIARQTGAGALKPGEKTLDTQKAKMVFVFDTSGSMAAEVPRVLSEVRNLLAQLGKSDVDVGIVFFAGEYKSFVINVAKNNWAELNNPTDLLDDKQPKKRQKGYKTVLGLGASGGTDFTTALATQLAQLAAGGYNVMIFSDSDIAHSQNVGNLQSLWTAHKEKIFSISVNLSTFQQVCQQIGVIPRTFSYLS
jgi:hypothetical protein